MDILANVMPEKRFFDLLDRLGDFLRLHSLEVLVGIILLTFYGGIVLLLWLRRHRPPAGSPHVPLIGIFWSPPWPRIHDRQEAPPPRCESEPWDD